MNKLLESGTIVTDRDGAQWRIVGPAEGGTRRVRVGSLAEALAFPAATAPVPSAPGPTPALAGARP